MSIYIDGLEIPKEGNETIIRIQPDGVVLDQYGHHLNLTAITVPKHDGPLISALEVINSFPDEYIFTNEQAKALLHYIIPADRGEAAGEGGYALAKLEEPNV